MKTPTYAEIGAACGVSAATVSRALSNNPAIPQSTRDRVLATARQLGWRPNPLASAYMAHRRSTRPASFKAILGVLVDFPMPNGREDLPDHVQRTYRGFEARAIEYGYTVKAFSLSAPELSPAKLDRTMASWNIPGFLITSMSQPGRVLEGIDWPRYAMIAFGHSLKSPAVHRVVHNMHMGIKLAIEQTFRMGYQRIGVAVSEEYDHRTKHGVMFPVSYMARNLLLNQSIETFMYREADADSDERIADWLRQSRPELVMGMLAPTVFDRLGWRVPEDIARVTFDRSAGSHTHAGLDLSYEAGGSLAADFLIGEIMLNRRGIPPRPIEFSIESRWVDGESAPRRV